jgi:HAD superfamily hydrolase (TIGR01490 family)
MSRAAAFFDLDGTLLSANTARMWFQEERRNGRIALSQALEAAAWMGLYGLGLMKPDMALSRAAATVKGEREADMRARLQDFFRQHVATLVAPGGREALAAHRARGEPLVLVTAATEYLAECVAADLGLDAVLAQRFAAENGVFTGELVKPLCYGEGKVILASAWAEEHGVALSESTFYTDSVTDLPLLLAVGKPVAVRPDPRLRREAARRGWPIVRWDPEKPSLRARARSKLRKMRTP